MNYQKLELHIAQVERAISQFRCKFHDARKQSTYNDLVALFRKIKGSDYKLFNEDQLMIAKETLDEVFFGIEYLDYKRISEIPSEIIFCLDKALYDWIDDHSRMLIVTSLNNKLEEFEMQIYPDFKAFRQNIMIMFSHDYNQSLIKINKPRLMLNDFLSAVPLYHELGHFIDQYYQISENILRYEPKLSYLYSRSQDEINETYYHYSEYFADLFAAQYVGNSLNEYLNYIAFNQTKSFTHPSTSKRSDIVTAFLSNTSLPEVDYIKHWTPIRANGRLVAPRNAPLTIDPFITETPLQVPSISEIHDLFPKGWAHWLNENSPLRQKYADSTVVCGKINKIIKNSIRLSMPNNRFEKLNATLVNFSNTYSTIKRNLSSH